MNHGHLTPNPNGSVARCGGPGICMECSLEADQKKLDGLGSSEFDDQQIEQLKKFHKKSTPVVEWYPYSGGDCYGPEASVRGPCFRWLKVTPAQGNSPAHRIAEDIDDAKYAAAAMNAAPRLVSKIEKLNQKIQDLELALHWARKVCERVFAGFEQGIDSVANGPVHEDLRFARRYYLNLKKD